MFSFFKKIYSNSIRLLQIIRFRVLVFISRLINPIIYYPYRKNITLDNFKYSLKLLRNTLIFGYLFLSFQDYAFNFGWDYCQKTFLRTEVGCIGAGGPVVSSEYGINIHHWYVLSSTEILTYLFSIFIIWIAIIIIGMFLPVVREQFTHQSLFLISLIIAVISDITDYFYLWFIDVVLVELVQTSWVLTILLICIAIWIFVIQVWISVYVCDEDEDAEDAMEELFYFAWLLKNNKKEPWHRFFIRFSNSVSRNESKLTDIFYWTRKTPEELREDQKVWYWTDENIYEWRTDGYKSYAESFMDLVFNGRKGTANMPVEPPDELLYQYFEHCAKYPEEIVTNELWLYKQNKQNLKGTPFSLVRFFYYINKIKSPMQWIFLFIGYFVGLIKMLFYWKIYFRKPQAVGPYLLYDPFTCKKRIWRWVCDPLTLFIPNFPLSYREWVGSLKFQSNIYRAYCEKHYKLEHWVTLGRPLKTEKIDTSQKL